MNEFEDGQLIKGAYFTHDGDGYVSGQNCEKITVSMENGQMARVPWFAVWKNGVIIEKYNGALLASVDTF